MVKRLLVGHAGRRSALTLLMFGALLGGCGGSEDPEPKAKAAQPAKKAAAPATAELDKPEPTGPSQIELAIDYRNKLDRLDKRVDREQKALLRRFKHATTPASYIKACRIYKQALNRIAHKLSVLDPPRSVRKFHRREIVLVRRVSDLMTDAIAAARALDVAAFDRLQARAYGAYKKGKKADRTISQRLARLIAG